MRVSRIQFISICTIIFTLQSRLLGQTPNLTKPVSLPRYMEDAVVLIVQLRKVDEEQKFITLGTGFALRDDSTGETFVITCRHIVTKRDSLLVRFNDRNGKGVKKNLSFVQPDGTTSLFTHPDTTVDLAAIIAPKDVQFRVIGSNRLKPLSEMKIGDEILFIGFPLAELSLPEKNYPILRKGMVSLIAEEDIMSLRPPKVLIRKGQYLVDGKATGGVSGGPVLTSPRSRSPNQTSIGGMVFGALTIQKDQNIGLSLILSADRILELLEYIRKQNRATDGSGK